MGPGTLLNFGGAMEALKQGMLVARTGWNGKGMFIFMRKSPTDLKLTDLLGMNTMPKGVKSYYEGKNQPITQENNPVIVFTDYLCMKAADDSIVNGWLASQTDMLANDWQVVM